MHYNFRALRYTQGAESSDLCRGPHFSGLLWHKKHNRISISAPLQRLPEYLVGVSGWSADVSGRKIMAGYLTDIPVLTPGGISNWLNREAYERSDIL